MGTYYDTSALVNGQPQDISVIKSILDVIDAKLLEIESAPSGGGANYFAGWQRLEKTFTLTTTGSYVDVEFIAPNYDIGGSENLDFTGLTSDGILFTMDGLNAGTYLVTMGFNFNGDNDGRVSLRLQKDPVGAGAEAVVLGHDYYMASSLYIWSGGGGRVITFNQDDTFRFEIGNFTADTSISVTVWASFIKLHITVE